MIYDVRVTASPAYELHNLCLKAGIPYVHILNTRSFKREIEGTTFVPNKLAYVSSVAALNSYWDGLVVSKTPWSIIVRASEEEAGELNFPYTERAHLPWVMRGLMNEASLIRAMTKTVAVNANLSYLGSVITELYRIQPKEARPFKEVFRYLSGVSPKLDLFIDKPSLIAAVKAALPIRRAIKELKKDRTIENIRKISKQFKIDIFEINYTLAKGSVKELDLSDDPDDDNIIIKVKRRSGCKTEAS